MTDPLPEPSCDVTPDGTFVFELALPDGRRAVATVLPEEVDEVAGPRSADPPPPEEKRRRYQVARLLADLDLRAQLEAGAATEEHEGDDPRDDG